MADIRKLEFDDLPAVAALLRLNLPGWDRGEAFLASTLLEHRFADAEPPSMVAVEGSKVVGFMGAQSRALEFSGRTLLGVCASQLAVDPEHRAGAAGALLIRRLLSGDQDLTWVDNATDLVARIWRTFGGTVDAARTVDWMLVLRPGRWTRGVVGEIARERTVRRLRAPVPAIPFQTAGPRLLGRAFPEPDVEVAGAEATAAEVVAALPLLAKGVKLRVSYREEDLSHQLVQIAKAAGSVVCRLVRDGDRPVGWYAYIPRSREASRALHIEAIETHTSAVLADLIADARGRGCVAISGRVEPHLMLALRDRFAALGFGVQPLIHTRDSEIRATLPTAAALLTELDNVDSAWW